MKQIMMRLQLLILVLYIQVISGANKTSKLTQAKVAPSSIFKKCHCPGNKIEILNDCVEGNFTSILIWDSKSGREKLFDLSNYENVIIQPLTCPDNFAKASYYDFAIFTPEGKLLITPEPETDLYCVENTIFDQQPIHKIEVCISKTTVPLCCDQDQLLAATWECLPLHSNLLSTAAARWPDGFDYVVDHLDCTGQTFESHEIIAPSFIHALEFKRMITHFDMLYNGSFCIAILEANSLEYLIKSCDQSCVGATCIPLCCPFNQVYDVNTHRCLPHNESSISMIQQLVDGIHSSTSRIPSRMTCTDQGILTYDEDSKLKFLPNNSLVVTSTKLGSTATLEPNKFCLGNFHFADDSIRPSGLHCLYDPEEEPCSWRWTVIRAILIVSSLFIMATLAVYLGVPELRRRIQGACLISELISLLISQINLVILQINQSDFSPDGCLAAGVIGIIFTLSSFFWLNVICYDVWSTFRKLRPFNENLLEKKLFAKYSLYAWGIPLLVGIVVVIVEKMELQLRPNFAPVFGRGCFFYSNDLVVQWLYLYSIILLLLLINCGFFIHLAIRLLPAQLEQRKTFKMSRGGKTTSNQNNVETENLILYLKLFVIMGLPWLIEILSSFATKKHECFIWIVDMINLLRGVFIFIIFVTKQTTRKKIIAAWCSIPRELPSSSSESSRKTSLMSLNSWFRPRSRTTSKASLGSGGHVQMGVINPSVQAITEEDEE